MRRMMLVSVLVLLSATFAVLGLLAPAGADDQPQPPDYPAYPGAPAAGCIVFTPNVAQTGDTITITKNCGEPDSAFLNKEPWPGGLPDSITVPCDQEVIRSHTFTGLFSDSDSNTVYIASVELLVTGPGPNCAGVPSVAVYSCPVGSTPTGGSGPTLTCALNETARTVVSPNISPNAPIYSCPAGSTETGGSGPSLTCATSRTVVSEIAAEEVGGELSCPASHPTAKAGNICSSFSTVTEPIAVNVQQSAPTITCPEGTTTNGADIAAKLCIGPAEVGMQVAPIRTFTCPDDSITNGASGQSKACLPLVAPTAVPAPTSAPQPTSGGVVQQAPATVQPAPAPAPVPAAVAPAPAPIVVHAAPVPVVATAASHGFGSSLPVTHAATTDTDKKATGLAHTGSETTYFLYAGLTLIAAGAVLMGSRRRELGFGA